MKTITGLSPAKINLTLDIFPKEKGDLFHPIRSIGHKISLADEFTLSEYDEFMIEGNFDCHPTKNLIWKAFELLQKFVGSPLLPVKVTVKKNIPFGSGLGGGSSNFATFVTLYRKLFDLGPITPEFIHESGKIGKDIPFFFEQKMCSIMEHFGEKVTPLPFHFSGQKIFLFLPPFAQSTAEAYEKITGFHTDYTGNFLLAPSLQNCKNAFDELFSQSRYHWYEPQESGFWNQNASICSRSDSVPTSRDGVSNQMLPSLARKRKRAFVSLAPFSNQISTPRQKEIHMAGSGSAFWSTRDQEFPECKKVQAQLL